MTKGKATLPGRPVAEQKPIFITLGGPQSLRENPISELSPAGTPESSPGR